MPFFLFAVLTLATSILSTTQASAASVSYGPTGYGLYGATWQQLFSIASQETIPSGIAFNNDGSKMFISGSGTDRVNEYALSTNFDISTASFTQYFSVSAQDTSPTGVSFNSNGTKMFIVGSTNDRVYEYNLGTGFNVSTASFSQYFSVSAQDGTPLGLEFSTDGSKMFMIGSTNDKVFSYSLSSAFDVSSASYSSESLDVSSQETGGQAITFDDDGTRLFVTGSVGDDINEYGSGENGFREQDINDGSVEGKIEITLTGDTFKDLDADNVLDINTEVVVNNIPSGLTPSIALTASDTVATLTLSGYATNHLNSDDVADITFNFKNAAFTGGNASSVTNATGPASSGYGVDFDDSTFVNTTRVSLNSSGAQGSETSDMPVISADGRYVAFLSYASNLVSGDTNFYPDVFVRDTQTNITTRVSVATGGTQTGGNISTIAISGDGRYVTFSSDADNVVAGDTNGLFDVFLHDRDTNTTTRVSVDSGGNQSDGSSDFAAISDDGRYITFYSDATNLVADDLNSIGDLFLHDTQTGETSRVSMDENGGEANAQSYYSAISEDGRYIAFSSYASLVSEDVSFNEDVYLYDTQLEVLKLVSKNSLGNAGNGPSTQPSISGDGRYISYNSGAQNLVASDTNNQYDTFLYDNNADTTTLVSVDSNEVQGDGFSYSGSVSDDGRFVAFASDSTNLIASDTNLTTDVFLRDTVQNKTYRISTSTDGVETNDASYATNPFVISSNGKKVAYASYATNLVAQDTNGYGDIFLATLGIYNLEFTAGANGSVSGDTSQTVVHGEDGTAITAIADTGYHFVDWSDGSTDNPRTDLNVLGDITVTANFEADSVDDPDPETGSGSDGGSSGSSDSITSEPASDSTDSSTPTEDSDSIPNEIEDAAPNGGDANDDGIKDSLQNNVASFVNKVTGKYVVLEVSEDCVIQSAFISNETENESPDESAAYPLGLMNFTIKCAKSGQTSNIKQYYYTEDADAAGLVMRKYSQQTNKYTTLTNAAIDALTIGKKSVIRTTYEVRDGGELDEDGLKNGVIVDPAGLARENNKENAKAEEGNEIASSVNYLPHILSTIGTVVLVYLYIHTKKAKKKN